VDGYQGRQTQLYGGGNGMKWVNEDGSINNTKQLIVRTMTTPDDVQHLDWTDKYEALEAALGIDHPGFIAHEAVQYSAIRRQWVFLPRKVSNESFDASTYQKKGGKVLLVASENFTSVSPLYCHFTNTLMQSSITSTPDNHREH